ncbi:MAG: hypothetical protein ABEJ36_01900 [Candidatus Nanosalina sp.]
MVIKEEYEGVSAFKCEVCGMHYGGKEMAEKCEEFCRENGSCSSEITSKSLERS